MEVTSGPVIVTHLETGEVEELPPIRWREAKVSEVVSDPYKLTGEALAAEVATRVMGWKVGLLTWNRADGSATGYWIEEDFKYKPRKDMPEITYALAFRPDTSIAQAWEVLEHVAKDLCFQIDNVGFTGEKYRVMIGWSDDPISVIAEADTAPLAICKAALLAAAALEAK